MISKLAVDREVMVYRIAGAFFFRGASTIGNVLDGICRQAQRRARG